MYRFPNHITTTTITAFDEQYIDYADSLSLSLKEKDEKQKKSQIK